MNLILYFLLNVLIATAQEDKEKDPCGQKEFYDPSGTIQSPAFPANYPDDSNCFYRILTNRMINVTFNSFSLEQSEDCRYDYLQVVFQANKANSTSQRYCGDGLGKVNGGVLRGQGPLIIGFKSDESDNLNGFSFSFEFELNGPDPCLSEPCQHGGNCTTYPSYYTCDCHEGYAGINCEIDKDECLSFPCQNQGVCTDGLNSFTCDCPNGFEGELCDIRPELCVSNPCLNGGLCVERGVDYVCSCPRDFMGDHCESPVPTPTPPTTTPPATTTTSPAPETIATTAPPLELPDDLEPPDGTDSPLQPPGKEETNEESDYTVVIAVAAVGVVLLLALGLGWYCWKTNRNVQGIKPTREITLINMKTKSEAGRGMNGRRSRTTSFNSVTMKSDAKDKFLNQIHKMSGDVIMEEITDDSGSSVSRPLAPSGPIQVKRNLPAIKVDDDLLLNNSPAFNRLSIPVTKSELNRIAGDGMNHNEGARRATQAEPLHISPEDAVELLNQMKRTQAADWRSALEQYGLSSLPKNSFKPKYYSGRPPEGDDYQLPNVPIPTKPIVSDHSQEVRSDLDTVELSPAEAAEVVNHFLQTDSLPRSNIGTREAMDIIQEVTNKRRQGDWPTLNREKSVVVHPQDMANLVNILPRANPVESGLSMDRNSGSVMTSTYAISEAGDRHPFRINRDFRGYSPIQEEEESDAGEAEKIQENKQKRPSQDFGTTLEEPELKRLRKKSKRFPYARTIDPDEKVHDWLKNTSKQKAKHGGPMSPNEANPSANQTIITRPLPTFNQQNTNKKRSNPILHNKDEETPRIIRHARKMGRESKSSIAVTENKAKSLVEKLVKAPARSSENVVGPGLSVSRENAFVEENF